LNSEGGIWKWESNRGERLKEKGKRRILGTGCWILDAGCWVLGIAGGR
jgi:hypothetical protein